MSTPSVATWPRWCLPSSGPMPPMRSRRPIPTSSSLARSTIPVSTATTWPQASTGSMTRWACTTPCAPSSATSSLHRPSAGPGSRPTTFVTTCCTFWRIMTSSAWPATSLPLTAAGAFPPSWRQCSCSRIPSCSMPARSMANAAWTRKASPATTAVPRYSTIGVSTRYAVLPRSS